MSFTILILEPEETRDLAFYAAAFARELPDVALITASSDRQAIELGRDATVLMAKAHAVSRSVVDGLPSLKWIQALTTGTDALTQLELPESITITSARGIHGPQMSELALLMMMALSRNLPQMLKNQALQIWSRWPQALLYDKTIVLVGVGAISEDLATRCKALGMTVRGISDARREVAGFDSVHPRSQLVQVAAEADFLVVLVPYESATHHLIGRDVLNAMPKRAHFINIARGKVVDEAALVDALQTGQIAGAGLDVFSTEPLPAESPLWAMPNVIITPRIGGMSDVYARQLLPLMLENARAFADGRAAEMRNVVVLGRSAV